MTATAPVETPGLDAASWSDGQLIDHMPARSIR